MLDKNKAEKSHHHHRHVCRYSKKKMCMLHWISNNSSIRIEEDGKTVNYMSTLARNVTELHIISKHVAPGLENLLFASESIDYELLGTDRLWPSALVSIRSRKYLSFLNHL